MIGEAGAIEIPISSGGIGAQGNLSKAANGENETGLERERFEAKKKEVVERVKNGEDLEGRKLYDAYVASLKNWRDSDTSKLFVNAEASVMDIGRAGEANKAVVAMDALYKKLGADGYKLDQENIPTGLSPEERSQFIREKITADYFGLTEKFADKFIEGYAGAMVELSDAKDKLKEVTSGENPFRPDVREVAYGVEDKKRKLMHVVHRGSVQIADRDTLQNLKDEIGVREEKKVEVNAPVFFDRLGEEEQGNLIDESADQFRQGLDNNGKQRESELVERLRDDERRGIFIRLTKIDKDISNKRREIENNLNADPWVVCLAVSELKQLQLDRKYEETTVNVRLAEKRVDEAKAGWEKSWDNTLSSFSQGEGMTKSVEDLINAGAEWVSSKGQVLGESFKKEVLNTLEKAGHKLEQGFDKAVEVVRAVDERFVQRAKNGTVSFLEKTGDFVNRLHDTQQKIKVGTQSGILTTERDFYDKVHDANIFFRESGAEIAEGSKRFFQEARVRATGKVGEMTGRNLDETVAAKIKELESVSLENLRGRIDDIREANKDNPHHQILEGDLERRLGILQRAQKAVTETAKEGRDATTLEQGETIKPEETPIKTPEPQAKAPQAAESEIDVIQVPGEFTEAKPQAVEEKKQETEAGGQSGELSENTLREKVEDLGNRYKSLRAFIDELIENNKITTEAVAELGNYGINIGPTLKSISEDDEPALVSDKLKIVNKELEDLASHIWEASKGGSDATNGQ